MLRFERPPGTPDWQDAARARHVQAVKATELFKDLPKEDRISAVSSLAHTVRRASYHRGRFEHLRKELDARRVDLPGDILWDELVEAVHFELQGVCSACRSAVDEVVYLVARRKGVSTKAARTDPWLASALVTAEHLPAKCDVDEIRLLRRHREWFATVNAFRNSVTHHGWRHGSGHYEPDHDGASAAHPAANALLVPDVASLGGKAKPFEWTYSQHQTVDDVVAMVWRGLDSFLRELFEGPWQTPEPPPGTMPRVEHANMIVMLPRPAIIFNEREAFIPVFSSEEKGRACAQLRSRPDIELRAARPSSLVVGKPAVTFAVSKIDIPIDHLYVVLDPVPITDDWTQLRSAARTELDLSAIAKAGPCAHASLPLVGPIERAFMWVARFEHAWI